MSISTIDAFFHRLMSVYRHEIGLPSGLRLTEENAPEMLRLRQAAIAELMLADGTGDGTLLSILDSLHGGNTGRSVAGDLQQRLGDAYKVYTEASESAWTTNSNLGTLLSDSVLDVAIANLEYYSGVSDKRVIAALASNASSARSGDWKSFFSKGLAKPLMSADAKFYGKPIAEDIISIYEPLLVHGRTQLLRLHFAATAALREILDKYNLIYVHRRNTAGLLLFGDVPDMLKTVLPNQNGSDLSYRLGSAISHLLLDEFQDTSPAQYSILRPFASAIQDGVKPDGSIFCVGDRKQSIYGWRGATPEVFDRIGIDLPSLEWTDNNVSFRSSQFVLDTANRLFSNLVHNPLLADEHAETAARWQDRFGDHIAHFDLGGFVELVQPSTLGDDAADTDTDTDTDSDEANGSDSDVPAFDPFLDYCARKVKAISDATPHASVGILTRNTATVKRMIFALARYGVSASIEGGGSITDDPAVALVLSAFQLVDHPGDTAAQFHVANSPLGPLVRLSGPRLLAPNLVALAIRRQLVDVGYGATVSRWATGLAPSCDARGLNRLSQLIEVADVYDLRTGTRPSEFVEHVRAQSIESPSPSRVRVMTIHKAKGLEFDVVVLPEMAKKLIRSNPLLFRRNPETLEIDAVTLYPAEPLQTLEPALKAICDDATSQQLTEALCLLYVAMTRARRALHIIVPPLKTKNDGTARKAELTFASIVRAGLVGNDGITRTDLPEQIWTIGDSQWHRLPSISSDRVTAVRDAVRPARVQRQEVLVTKSDVSPRIRRRVTPSETGTGRIRTVEELLGIAGEDARMRGVALHALFDIVEWADIPLPTDSHLMNIASYAAPEIGAEEIADIVRDFRRMLAQPAVADALARPASRSGEAVELWRERRFSVITDDGSLISGRFDRVTITRDQETNKTLRAGIIDFKTDSMSDSGRRQAAVEMYRAQILKYARALESMVALPSEAVEAKLLFVENGEFVDCASTLPIKTVGDNYLDKA